MRRVVAAALRFVRAGAEETVYLPPPARHADVVAYTIRTGQYERGAEQGFLADDGAFLTREEAAVVARDAGQLLGPPFDPAQLYSEDVW